MIIKRFNKINGFYPEPISGQTRFAFSKNDFEDFYDIKEYFNYKDYRGQKLYFMIMIRQMFTLHLRKP